MTSDRAAPRASGRHGSAAKAAVVIAIVGAAAFGLSLGYLAWTNDSFPAQTRPFADYANVTWSSFNGTELAFRVTWANSSYLPLKAQLTSPDTDAANTPVCGMGLLSVASGQTIFMPFTISPQSPSLSSVALSIDVQPVGGGSDFTITYNVPGQGGVVVASNAPISPSNVTCQEPPGSM